MRSAYRVIAGLIALLVVVQSAAMVYAVAGLGIWVEEGGTLDKAAFESGESLFPEEVGFMIHGMNGMMLIPLMGLVLLIVSFFAKIPRGIVMAAVILGLIVLQVALGIFGHSLAFAGLLHGINALILLGAAIEAARIAKATTTAPAQETVAV